MGQVTSALNINLSDAPYGDVQDQAWEHYADFLAEDVLARRGELLVQYHGEAEVSSSLGRALSSASRSRHTWTRLRLSANWITALDTVLKANIRGLKDAAPLSLDLRENRLSSARSHSTLTSLTSLTELNLSRNSLTAIPSELNSLHALTLLDLSHNSISELPASLLASLRRLRVLSVAHNAISRLPDGLGVLTELRTFDLDSNNLWEKALPDSFADLTSLESLNLAHNMLLEVQPLLSSLSALTALSLTQTRLHSATLPSLSSLRPLTALRSLSLAHLGLTSLPDSLSSLVNLTSLDLAFNKLDAIPHSDVSTLRNLEKISLLMNPLKRLPRALFELPRLRVIALRGCPLEIESEGGASTSLSPSLMLGSVAALRVVQDQSAFERSLEDEERALLQASSSSTGADAIDRDALALAFQRPRPIHFGALSIPTGASTLSSSLLVDRILGLVFGSALADAVGLSAEFMTRETALFYYDAPLKMGAHVSDRHRNRWIGGDWTDDTDQTLLVLDTLVAHGGRANIKYFAHAIHNWMHHGVAAHGDFAGSGLGANTHAVLNHSHFLDDPLRASMEVWERSGRVNAANGAVMRTATVGVPFFWSLADVIANARLFSRVTHSDPRCIASSVADGLDALIAESLKAAYAELDAEPLVPAYSSSKTELAEVMHCSHLHRLRLDEGKAIGYTYKALGAGFWALRQKSFEGAITALTFEAGDSDTNGAVAGALLGCKVGYSQLPKAWLDALPHHAWLMAKAYSLLDLLGI